MIKKESAHFAFLEGFTSIFILGIISTICIFASSLPASLSMASMQSIHEYESKKIKIEEKHLSWEKYEGERFWYYEVIKNGNSIFRSRDQNITNIYFTEKTEDQKDIQVRVIKRKTF